MGRVSGKVAIITGAGSGLGAAHAATLAKEGAQVVLTDIDEKSGRAQSDAIPGSIFLRQDVREEARWSEIVDETAERFGRLDVLVNNAGLVRYATIEDCLLEDYRYLNAVMAEGTFLGCKAVIPAMKRSGGGSIINTSSVASIRARGIVPAYSAAKGAITSLTLSIAAHCKEKGYNIRCNVVLPGAFETQMAVTARRDLTKSNEGGLAHAHNKLGDPQDVANLILFLASDESAAITGTSIVIDNGQGV